MIKRLSDEVVWDLVGESATTWEEDLVIVAKASHDNAVRQVVEWGNDTCPHDIFGEGTKCLKHACDMCWQELKEAGGEHEWENG